MTRPVHASLALLLLGLSLFGPAGAFAAALPDFRALVEENQQSIVNITTTQTVRRATGPLPGLPRGTPFDEFFRRFEPDMPPGPERDLRAGGSGFVISRDGKILTNAHVVADAESIQVRFADKTELPARLLGVDRRTDIALLQVERSDLRPVRLGDSSRLQVGEWVLAVGSPFGLEYTATQGIVSAIGRSLPSDSYVPFIQTDAAVNPGNSGGPLFNTDGEVIGINSQIYSRTGGYMGLSFAIPIDLARNVAAQLENQGYVSRGWLGVSIQGMTSELARSFGLDRPSGALISAVEPDGPAAAAGLRAGDVILGYDGQAIQDSGDLPPRVGETPIGRNVPVEIWRDGKRRTVKVEIRALEEPDQQRVAGNAAGKGAALNVQLAELTPQQREQRGIASGGALVVAVGDGPAARAGIRRGDVLLEIAGREVEGTRQLGSLVEGLPKQEPLAVLVQRGEGRIYLSMTLQG